MTLEARLVARWLERKVERDLALGEEPHVEVGHERDTILDRLGLMA